MTPPFVQANTNGRLHPANEPSIAPLNRGFLYGDAIYEVWRTYEGAVFAWEEHWTRLQESAAALFMEIPWSPAEIRQQIARTAKAYRTVTGDRGELYVRLQISRGGGAIGLDMGLADQPDFVILVQACPVTSPAVASRGLKLAVASALRRNPIASLNPAWKTGNYLNNLLCLREARARGADDVLMLNLSGEVTEAATSNIAFIRDGELLTPPLEAGILAGITRALVLGRVAPTAGVPVREVPLRPADFVGCEECFLLSTTKGISPVGKIDELGFKLGAGTVTERLQAAFAAHVREWAAVNSRWRV